MALGDLIEFDAVLAIARRGSFRAAALELGLSTTAMSNAIAKLERQLGVRLFNRTLRSVSLTEAGRQFVDQAASAVKNVHAPAGKSSGVFRGRGCACGACIAALRPP